MGEGRGRGRERERERERALWEEDGEREQQSRMSGARGTERDE